MHHGMIYVPPGYTMPGGKLFPNDEVRGGSAWGAGWCAASPYHCQLWRHRMASLLTSIHEGSLLTSIHAQQHHDTYLEWLPASA